MKYQVIELDDGQAWGFFDSWPEARGFIKGLLENPFYRQHYSNNDFRIMEVQNEV